MILREKYIAPIREFYDSDLIKIITGVRRSGKSIVLEQIFSEIRNHSKNTIYLNFEDRAVSSTIDTCDKLLEFVAKNRKKGKCFVFLDEVQNVEDWPSACKTLRLHDNSVFITGSNSKLLSKEFTRELSGRYVAFQVRPFIFKEIEEYCSQLRKTASIQDYLVYGGFPKRFEFDSDSAVRQYLNDLDQTIVLNDIINRYRIKKPGLFKKLANFVLISNARTFSAKSIYNIIRPQFAECSVNTITKYLGYLKEAYIISSIRQYSTKAKRELNFFEKIYNADVAFNSIRVVNNRFDITHNLENIVYNELLYMGYNLTVFQDKQEIDFCAEKGNKKYYIQVAYSVVDPVTYEREMGAFSSLDNSCSKILITNDDLDYSTSTVKHIKLKDFLKMEDLA
ncbi:MAG: ATP-binding protein [Fibrobacteraceae bacterium]|nr:ATP-binding protein [Fibrobacteraceae bacterium]